MFGSKPNLFFKVTLCLENLSSGENLAGCADLVTSPSSVCFLRVYILFPSGPKVYIKCMVGGLCCSLVWKQNQTRPKVKEPDKTSQGRKFFSFQPAQKKKFLKNFTAKKRFNMFFSIVSDYHTGKAFGRHPPHTQAAMSSDLFSDLLKQSISKPVPANDSNLSLNQKMARNTSKNNSNLDLDFLDTYVSSKNSSSGLISQENSLPKQNAGNIDLGFDLDAFTSSSSVNSQRNNVKTNETKNTGNTVNTANAGNDLLDDFFGTSTLPTKPNSNTTPEPVKTPVESLKHAVTPEVSNQDLRDEALAELLEMGFPISKANRALDSTSNGHDINEAISFLMHDAHKTSNSTKSNLQSPQQYQSRNQNQEDFGKIVSDLSTDFMSTASFLFDSGRKKIQQGVEMYRQQRLDNNNGQPMWMKNQERYKANSILLPGEEDHQVDDNEKMQELIKKQRIREQRLKRDITMKSDILSVNDEISNDNYETRSNNIRNHDEIYTSSSRHRKVESASKPIPKTVPEVQTGSLLDISSSNQPTSNTFSIEPLSSAQQLTFKSSREIAQEKYKSGDYTSSLEHYLDASNVIPSDHPFQIIINSNLALVYSKLGNPKKQLAVSEKGLKLINENFNDSPVSKLSTVIIEDNKNVKSFWIKLMLKKAESLEFLEKWNDAKSAYELLISSGENSKPVMDGKNRCVKAINPKPVQKTSNNIPKKSPTVNTNITRKNNEAVKKVYESNLKQKKDEEEKFLLHDKIEDKLNNWRAGKKDNIRALICSLDTILWPQLNWKPIKLTDLVLDKKVKICYMKAVSKTHPDKISKDETVENKMIANGVFITLNEAWERFKLDSGM